MPTLKPRGKNQANSIKQMVEKQKGQPLGAMIEHGQKRVKGKPKAVNMLICFGVFGQ